METFANIISDINGIVWGWPMIILLVGTHLFLTIRLKFPQRKMWTAIKLSVKSDKGSTGDVSQFGALATSLAATIGTGNIIGVATAVAMGGPGAILWCFLTGIFGIATKYGEGLLAVKYRVKNKHGKMHGGPMYALERGLGMRWLGVVFCVFTMIAAFGIGNMVQANAISENILEQSSLGLQPETARMIIGLVLALLTGIVIVGGVSSISKFCTSLVPLMAGLYIVGCIIVLCVNSSFIWPAVQWICRDAFSLRAGVGGTVGAAIMTTMRFGIARGLFSNEAGLGSAPIVAAAAQSKNPARQALVLSSGAFWDTVVICTLTGLVVVTGAMSNGITSFDENTPALTQLAFGVIPYGIGRLLLTIGIITFAFSTIIGWSYYGEQSIAYLSHKHSRKLVRIYRLLWVLLIIVGSVLKLDVVWNISDVLNAFMAFPNLVSLLLLSGVMAKITQYYVWENRLDEEASDDDSSSRHKTKKIKHSKI